MAPNRSSSTTIKLKSMKLYNETDIDNTETLIDNYNKKVFQQAQKEFGSDSKYTTHASLMGLLIPMLKLGKDCAAASASQDRQCKWFKLCTVCSRGPAATAPFGTVSSNFECDGTLKVKQHWTQWTQWSIGSYDYGGSFFQYDHDIFLVQYYHWQ